MPAFIRFVAKYVAKNLKEGALVALSGNNILLTPQELLRSHFSFSFRCKQFLANRCGPYVAIRGALEGEHL